MHGITSLALLALTATAATAVQFNFKRYSEPDCNKKFHIAKDTNLHNPHCKTFDRDEPPFESFYAVAEEHAGDIDNKFCQIIVFDQPGCKGRGYTMSDESAAQSACGNPWTSMKLAGRSVKIECAARAKDISTISPTSTSTTVTKAVSVVSAAEATVTTTLAGKTRTMPPPVRTTTITLVPEAKTCDCD